MPNVSTYIRRDDFDAYRAIQTAGEWAEFIHIALNGNTGTVAPITKITTSPKIINSVEDVLKIIPGAKQIKYCKNGHAKPDGRNKCMGKGCKYAN